MTGTFGFGEENMIFGKKKNTARISYDKTGKIPVVRASICTGEKVAGFKDAATGKFEDLMLIRRDEDLREFMTLYDVKEEEIRKEW